MNHIKFCDKFCSPFPIVDFFIAYLRMFAGNCYWAFRKILNAHFFQFHSPMPYFDLRPDFITVILQNILTTLQLFVIILNCVGISDRSQYAQDANAVLSDMKFVLVVNIQAVCYFHSNSNHWFYLSETI